MFWVNPVAVIGNMQYHKMIYNENQLMPAATTGLFTNPILLNHIIFNNNRRYVAGNIRGRYKCQEI